MIDLLQTRSFSLHKMLIDGLEWFRYHSDGTHSLQRILVSN